MYRVTNLAGYKHNITKKTVLFEQIHGSFKYGLCDADG